MDMSRRGIWWDKISDTDICSSKGLCKKGEGGSGIGVKGNGESAGEKSTFKGELGGEVCGEAREIGGEVCGETREIGGEVCGEAGEIGGEVCGEVWQGD